MIYNDQNPHVFNACIYANSADGYVYEQSTFALVHRSANWLAFASGFVFSILSVYMILFRTPEHFRQFSRVLLLCAYSDVLYLFWCFCGQPRINNSDGTMLLTLTGPLKFLSYSGQCLGLSIQSGVMLLCYIILPIQYHFRYAILKNKQSSVCTLLSVYIILAGILSSLNGFIAYQSYCTFENPTKIDFAKFWYHEIPVPQLIVAPQAYFPSSIQTSYYGSIVLLAYLTILWFARLTYKELQLNADRMTSKTLKLQKQFSRALFVQSIVPLLLVVAPILASLYEIFTKVKMGNSSEIAILSTAFFPLLNSLSTLMFISHYRHQCAKLLLPCFQHKMWQQSSVRPQNESTRGMYSTDRTQVVPVEIP